MTTIHMGEMHAKAMLDGAIENAKRILTENGFWFGKPTDPEFADNMKKHLEAAGYEVKFKPWLCSCGRQFETRAHLNIHRTMRNVSTSPHPHNDATPKREPEL